MPHSVTLRLTLCYDAIYAVTAEVAGSSPVVPAIFSNHLRGKNGILICFCVLVGVVTYPFDSDRERI
jgi:hypothetical protein